jgi:aspartyl-tRNA(Asn)/glutamyl-tRNA(Gln) amidotransferase subunit C
VAIDEATVRHVARLARLDLTDEQIRAYGAQLSSILDYMKQLDAMDLSNVEPLAHTGDLDTPLREDQPVPGLARSEALRNAPAQDGSAFLVPRVIDTKDAP